MSMDSDRLLALQALGILSHYLVVHDRVLNSFERGSQYFQGCDDFTLNKPWNHSI